MAKTVDVNYYAVLDLDRDLSLDQLHEQLKQLRRKWTQKANAASNTEARHKAEDMLSTLQDASEVFATEKSRASYDKKLQKSSVADQEAVEQKKGPAVDSMDLAQLHDNLERYFDNDNYYQLFKACEKLIEADDADLDTYRYLSLGHATKGDMNGAMEALQQMLETLGQNDPNAYLVAAKLALYVYDGQEEFAKSCIDVLVKAGYQDEEDVAALQCSYLIKKGKIDKADAKIAEYRQAHPSCPDFCRNVAKTYTNYADDKYLISANGGAYIDDAESYKAYRSLYEKAMALTKDKSITEDYETIKSLGGRKFLPGSWKGILGCVIWAFASMSEMPVLGVLFILLAIALTYFSFVPKWVLLRREYTGTLPMMYKITSIVNTVLGVILVISWFVVKFIFGVVLGMAIFSDDD